MPPRTRARTARSAPQDADRDAASSGDVTTASEAADGDPENDDARRSPLSKESASPRRPKKRSTYDMRRETKAALLEQVRKLQRQLEQLEDDQRGNAAFDLQRARLRHQQLKTNARAQQHTLAGAQSMLSGFRGCAAWQSPLSTYVHLPRDMGHRRRILADLYEENIAVATAFMRERMRFLDLRHEQCLCESFEHPNGDFVFTRFDVTPFGAGVSVHRVFEEIMQHLNDHEISISENLGMITIVAAETDGGSALVRQNCLLSTLEDGLELESNSAIFSTFVDDTEHGGPFGITTVDFIDRDDLLVGSGRRIRKDISACSFVSLSPPTTSGEEPTVSLTRWSTLRLHAPPMPLTKDQATAVRRHIRAWPDVMINVVQERIGMTKREWPRL